MIHIRIIHFHQIFIYIINTFQNIRQYWFAADENHVHYNTWISWSFAQSKKKKKKEKKKKTREYCKMEIENMSKRTPP